MSDQMPASLMKLPPRQREFVREYIKDLNASQAAIRAGYARKNADVQGPRLLGNVGIKRAIAELGNEEGKTNAAIATKQEVLEAMTSILRAKHSDFLTMSADGVWFHDIGPETLKQAALKRVKTRVTTETNGKGESQVTIEKQYDEIELESKVGAAKVIAELQGYNAPTQMQLQAPPNIIMREGATDPTK